MPKMTVSQSGMVSIVRDILRGADLASMTAKIVRQKVMTLLGDQAGDDMPALKASVKEALTVVLADRAAGADGAAAPAAAAPPKERTGGEGATGAEPERAEGATELKEPDGPKESAEVKEPTEPKEETDLSQPKEPQPRLEAADTKITAQSAREEQARELAKLEDAPEDEEPEQPIRPGRRRPVKPLRDVSDDDDVDDDIDHKDDDGDFIPTDDKRDSQSAELPSKKSSGAKKERKAREEPPSPPPHDSDGHDSPSSPAATGRTPPKRPRDSKPATRAPKRSRSMTSAGKGGKFEKHLEKLRHVCTQMGVKVPPIRLRGKTTAEKCTAIASLLREKGVTEENPASLRKHEIAAHKARLEKEKELAGLDASNIIEEGGRSRRRRGAAPVAAPRKEVELPSDFSGAELEGESGEEEESDEYHASSQDSD